MAEGREVVFRADVLNECVVIAAALCAGERADAFRAEALRQPPDAFLAKGHAAVWSAVREARSRGLQPDPATLARLGGEDVDVAYLAELMAQRPDLPGDETLKFALEQLAWDRQKHVAVTGPVEQLLGAIQGGEGPERVRGLARQVAASFDGWGDRKYLHSPEELVREQVAEMRAEMAGRRVFPYGSKRCQLRALDLDEQGRVRMNPGCAPGQITVVTGLSGTGKSTLTAHVALGQARRGRKVLYGAWEMTGGVTLRLLATISLGLPRVGVQNNEELRAVETKMLEISKYVTFLKNPFRKRDGTKRSNERHLDLVFGYIADSGCDVFVADLWKRCLVDARPEDEEEALIAQQAMVEELGVHAVLLQQQRLKDVEMRADKRPTREGIKGSGAWVEVADTILGVHRPALWKAVTDNVIEVDVLKQRYAKWPIAVEFDWDPERGTIANGRTVEYEMSAGRAASETNRIDKMLGAPREKQERRR
jgi:archaellum biogenesis ATPase FlaH